MAQVKIPISELFGPVIQGEGNLAGQISFFLRTSFCGMKCTWCDSMHAVDPKQIKKNAKYLTSDEIVEQVLSRTADTKKQPWVTLTGGDPVIWDLTKVIHSLKLHGFRIAVETQGQLWQEWLEIADSVTCSPKPPSAGMDDKFDAAMLQKYVTRLGDRLNFKIVVFDEKDLAFAEKIHKWQPKVRMFLSSGTPKDERKEMFSDAKSDVLIGYRKLTDMVLKKPELYDVTVLPQLHVLLWGRALGR